MPRFGERGGDAAIVVCYEMTAGVTLARKVADFVARVKYRLLRLIYGRREMALMDIVPESQVALVAGQEARLG